MKQKHIKPEISDASLNGPMSGNNFKTVDSSVKKLLCPALGLADKAIKLDSDEEIESPPRPVQTKEPEESQSSSKKSKNKHRSRSRSRSRSPYHKKKKNRSRSRSRSRSPGSRHRRRSRSRSRDNRDRRQSDYSSSRSRHSDKKSFESTSEPVVGDIYEGTVSSIMQFGCFVSLKGFRKKTEGLVHISNLRESGRVNNAADVVERHAKVFVKVLSVTSSKIGLSMKDADQQTGKDLNPANTKRLRAMAEEIKGSSTAGDFSNREANQQARNPDRPDNFMEVPVNEDNETGRSTTKVKHISDFEKWEIQQVFFIYLKVELII